MAQESIKAKNPKNPKYTMNRNAKRICKIKDITRKDEIFPQLTPAERASALGSFILTLPAGEYSFYVEHDTESYLPAIVFKHLGKYACCCLKEHFLLDMGMKFPRAVDVDLRADVIRLHCG